MQHCKFSIFKRRLYKKPWWKIFTPKKDLVEVVECWVYGYGPYYPLDLPVLATIEIEYTGKDTYIHTAKGYILDVQENLACLRFVDPISDPDTREPMRIRVRG